MEPVPPRRLVPAFSHQNDHETNSSFATNIARSEHSGNTLLPAGTACSDSGDQNATPSVQHHVPNDHDKSALLHDLRELCLVLASESDSKFNMKTTLPGPGPSIFVKTLHGLWRMITTSPVGDRLHWSAIAYHIGSQFFVVNTLLAWAAYAYPKSEKPGQVEYGVGLTTLPGNVFFWIGALLEFLDVISKVRLDGRLIKDEFDYGSTDSTPRIVDVRQAKNRATQINVESWVQTQKHPTHNEGERQRSHLSFFQLLSCHSTYDATFNACIIQLVGATVYTMIGVADLPGISSALTPAQKIGLYWTPNIIASCCFVGASIFFMVGTQQKWYKPRPQCIVWWATAWSLVGSLGFLLNGILGPLSYGNWIAGYHCLLSNFWGSLAFLCASTCQIYDCANSKRVDSPPES